jgi:putative ABC transport system permease protein
MAGRLSELWPRLRKVGNRKQLDRDLNDELAFHLAKREQQNRDAGMDAEEARYAARRQLGNTTWLKERSREMWTFPSLESWWQDLRYGGRVLAKNLGFTIAVVLTLALGMGANTAVFSVLHAVLLRPLPYRDPDRLVTVWQKNVERQQLDKATVADFNDWKTRNRVFDDMAFSWDTAYTLTSPGDSQSVIGYQFSANFFSVLGARPLLGRTFLPEEGIQGRDRVAVISYRLWRSHFAGDKDIVGKTIVLNGEPYSVIGVMPSEFAHPSVSEDLWTPLPFPTELLQNRGLHVFQVIARLRSRVSIAQAQQELETLAQETARQFPQTNKHLSVQMDSIRETYTGNVRPALLVLQASVLFMLIIACANAGNMFLARAGAQKREVAIRRALGASRGQLFRQFLTQGLTLAALGTGAGVLLAWWGVQVLPLMFKAQLENLPLPAHARGWMNSSVLLFTLVITAMTSLIFGAVPAFHSPNSSSETLNLSSRATIEHKSALHFRRVLIVGQVALSLLLLVGSGLLIRTLLRLQSRQLGFETDHLLTCVFSLPPNRYSNVNKTGSFLEQVLAGVRVVAGVESAGAINTLPLSGMDARRPFTVPGVSDDSGQQNVAQFRVVTPDYFRAMRIPLREGRFFDERDRAGFPLVAIVNEKLARRLWPNSNPIGQRILVPDTGTPLITEIIGVVGDVRHAGLASEPPIEIYRPAYQTYWPFFALVIRTSLDPERVAGAIRQTVGSVDKDQPINSLRSMDVLAADSIALRRSSMLLMMVFAGVAVLLTSVGIYSLISYTVILRTHEIGVRIALGASRRDILKSVVGQTAFLALIGIAIGLIGVPNLTQFLSSLLFGVTTTDVKTLLVAIIVMMSFAAGAAYTPARRATRVDPMVALRYE